MSQGDALNRLMAFLVDAEKIIAEGYAETARKTREMCAAYLEREADKHAEAAKEFDGRWPCEEAEDHLDDAEMLRDYADRIRKGDLT